jgi:hypothetical protein
MSEQNVPDRSSLVTDMARPSCQPVEGACMCPQTDSEFAGFALHLEVQLP